ncbi:MAG: hypothetical protein KA761_07105 [Gemmatimonadaceae bacterium]|nr:hypothetical protein [Gemmatimonadaceae bacterium]
MRRKRPCSICRRWFLPDARVGGRQYACGQEACQRERHRRNDRQWRAANPNYDRGRRWEDAIAVAKAAPKAGPPANTPPPASGLPWDVVQDELKVEGRVILVEIARVMGRHVQDEMRRQVSVIVQGIAEHPPVAAQDAIAPGG